MPALPLCCEPERIRADEIEYAPRLIVELQLEGLDHVNLGLHRCIVRRGRLYQFDCGVTGWRVIQIVFHIELLVRCNGCLMHRRVELRVPVRPALVAVFPYQEGLLGQQIVVDP